jgi:hypothetical protein
MARWVVDGGFIEVSSGDCEEARLPARLLAICKPLRSYTPLNHAAYHMGPDGVASSKRHHVVEPTCI